MAARYGGRAASLPAGAETQLTWRRALRAGAGRQQDCYSVPPAFT